MLGKFEKGNGVFCVMCLSEEKLKTVGPFNLVSMPGEVKDPMQRNKKPVMGSLTLEKENSENKPILC